MTGRAPPPFLRAPVARLFHRWGETAIGLALALGGIRVALGGGWILALIGGAIALLGAAWALLAARRARFQGDPAAPGLVEIDEGRLTYLHPTMGGEIALHDLAELRLVTLKGRRVWHLADLHGRALLVPLDSAGAGDLFDAFASLPGLASHDLIAALGASDGEGGTLPALSVSSKLVWRRGGQGLRPL
ncbi:hypothetical protein [Pseudogemmobacter sonorensis]|uniref:hypothetical protein n=1 Tax=Pseudogemmobacter sonorensis TaxID=2989681 RepID=UPI0036C93F3E